MESCGDESYLREKTLLEIFLPQVYIEIALKILMRLEVTDSGA